MSEITDGTAGSPQSSETQVHIELIEATGQRMKALYLACIGQKCNDTSNEPLFNKKVSPWLDLYRVEMLISRNDCIVEINRRWDKKLFETTRLNEYCRPRPNQWKMPKLMAYLEKNRVDVPGDVQYLTSAVTTETVAAQNELNRRIQGIEAFARGEGQQDSHLKPAGGGQNWVGKIPLLRLIHCLVDHQEIIKAFRNRADLPSGRIYLDNRKSDGKLPKTVYDLLSDKWNDEDYTCCTIAITGPGKDDLALPIVIDHTQVKKFKKATAAFIKDKIADIIRDVVRIESNWKKSGEGEGSLRTVDEDDEYDDDDADVDNSDADSSTLIPPVAANAGGSSAIDLSEKAKYAKNSYLLYWWYMLDTNQLMKSSRQRLVDTVATGQHSSLSSKVPDVTWRSSSSIRDQLSVGGDSTVPYSALAESVATMAYAARYIGDMEAQDREKARTVTMFTQDQQSRIAIASRADSITSSIDKLKNEKRVLQRDLLKLQCEELDLSDLSNDTKRVKRLKLEINLLQAQVDDIEDQCTKKQEIVTALLQQEVQVDILTPSRKKNSRTPHSTATGISTLTSDQFSSPPGLEALNAVQRDLGLTDFTA